MKINRETGSSDHLKICENFTDQYLLSLNRRVFDAIDFLKDKGELFLVENIEAQLQTIYTNQKNYLFSLFEKFGNASITRLGDVHRKGRCTVLIERQTDKFIYKPLNAKLLESLNKILTLLNKHSLFDFYIIKVLESQSNYSVIEFIKNETNYNVEKFSYHYGALLLVITLLKGVDFHHENIFSVNSTPVVIDCESLFYPSLKNTKEHDVDATSMIPTARNKISIMSKNDLSISEIIRGIENASLAVKKFSAKLEEIIRKGGLEAKRIIIKPTTFYYEILSKSLHPTLLVDQRKRYAFLKECLSGKHIISKCAINAESKDLMRLDIPYFSCVNDQLFDSDDKKIEPAFCIDNIGDIYSNIASIDKMKEKIIRRVQTYG